MPEVVERRLLCDHPDKDGRDAKPFVIDDGRHQIRVLLCEDHAKPLVTMQSWGQRMELARQPRTGGLSDQHLKGLIEN